MHVLIAPDCFTGTLTATQAAEAMAEGWRRSAPGDLLTLMPLSDGGPGFLDVLGTSIPEGRSVLTTATDPLGREVPATLLVVEGDGRRTAYIESAQAAGCTCSPLTSATRPSPAPGASATCSTPRCARVPSASSWAWAAAAPTTGVPACLPVWASGPPRAWPGRPGARGPSRHRAQGPAGRARPLRGDRAPHRHGRRLAPARPARRLGRVRAAEGRLTRGAQALESALGRFTEV